MLLSIFFDALGNTSATAFSKAFRLVPFEKIQLECRTSTMAQAMWLERILTVFQCYSTSEHIKWACLKEKKSSLYVSIIIDWIFSSSTWSLHHGGGAKRPS